MIKNSLKTVHGKPDWGHLEGSSSDKNGPLFGPEPGSKMPLLEGSQGVQEGEGQVKPDNRVLSLRGSKGGQKQPKKGSQSGFRRVHICILLKSPGV